MADPRIAGEIYRVHTELREKHRNDEGIPIRISGKPYNQIHSFEPLSQTPYGVLMNRAPSVSGRWLMRGLFDLSLGDDVIDVILAVSAPDGSVSYGFKTAHQLDRVNRVLEQNTIRRLNIFFS